MKIYKYIIALILTLIQTACSNDNCLSSADDEKVLMTFQPKLIGNLNTRAFGDELNIDLLKVFVYEGQETLSKALAYTVDWSTAQNGVTLTLVKGRSYKLLFWAEDKDNKAYQITNDGNITVDYTDYTQGGFAKMKEMDAFYGISSIIVGPQVSGIRNIILTRPFAQLNFMDNTTQPEVGIHKAMVTFQHIPTKFNPFTGEVTLTNDHDVTFEFTKFTDETMEVNGSDCYYVASNYLFVPVEGTITVSATIDLQRVTGTSLSTRTIEFKNEKAIMLEKNKKTNVVGGLLP